MMEPDTTPVRDKNGRAPRGPRTTKGLKSGRLTGPQQQMLLDLFVTRFRGKEGGPGHGLNDQQIADRLGIGKRTVARYKELFIAKDPTLGKIIKGRQADAISAVVEGVGASLQDEPEPEPKQTPRQMVEGGILSIDEMLRILSELATAGPPQYRVQAVKLFDELQAVHRPVETFGPPVPLTESEREGRLVTIMDACGRATVDAAYRRAYGKLPPLDPEEAPQGDEEAPVLQEPDDHRGADPGEATS